MNLRTYISHVKGGTVTNQRVEGLAGRIIRGKKPEDFVTLTDDPNRKLVMLVGPDGLQGLLGKSGHDMLVEIGYESNYIVHKVQEGNQFKLVVFEATNGSAAKVATWDNVIEMVCQTYPAIADKLRAQADSLKATPFADIEAAAGFDLSEVDKIGASDDRYMTYERYQQANGGLVSARAFLYFTVHLRELFSGDGYTYTDDGNGGLGNRGMMEYIVPNMPIAKLGNTEIVDIEIQVNGTKPTGGTAMTQVSAPNIILSRKPSFWDPAKVDQWYQPDLEAAMREGRAAGLTAATKRADQNMLVLIDEQWDFTEKGRLPVTGMFEDVRRICERIIEGVYSGFYTGFMVTFDCHPPIVIHGSGWWKDEDGNMPDVSLPVMMKLVDPDTHAFEATFISGADSKIYYPAFQRKETVLYAQHLEATNQNNGMIWVFTAHCKVGTDGISLVPALAEVLYWAAAALKVEPICVWKGMIAGTDWFGPFKPCKVDPNHPQGGLQTVYLDAISRYDVIDITGEAKDFCVEAGTRQVMEYYGQKPDVLQKIRFINDTTSAIVPDSPAIAQFEQDMQDQGLTLVTHDQF